ncbi:MULTISPECIES: Tn7-like element transposition protein TnsE [Aliagarivorans]|uniref:Tn7-like element transposition protein TnsE n=1 Tax=Aliagarivorans TaxID=882379 RepID=UPI00040D981F|nr:MULTISPECIES: Tn7-like element transposition protein TnsE [Aliagarivorans]
MDKVSFDKFDDDVKIQGVGGLFRPVHGSTWFVNLNLSPKQDKPFVRLSNAPLLVRQRTLNPTSSELPAGLTKLVAIPHTYTWDTCRVKDCPGYKFHRPKDKDQYCFRIRSADGFDIYLPHFELARAMFFHDSYLSRAALEHDVLNIEFDIQRDAIANKAEVFVLEHSGYRVELLNNPECRRFLSWVLLDPHVRASFESISSYEITDGVDTNRYRTWDFKFDPPPLSGAELTLQGWIDSDTRSMLVWEVAGIRNLAAVLPAEVSFYHPKLKTYQEGEGGQRSGKHYGGGFNIVDEGGANDELGSSLIRTSATQIEFVKPILTKKVANKVSKGGKGEGEGEYVEEAKDVSTNEPTIAGDLPTGVFNNLEDVSDDSHLYLGKFAAFIEMVECLKRSHGCVASKPLITKLPKVPRCKKHLLQNDSNPRCIAIVRVQLNGKSYLLMEVDTSDAAKPLSTKLIEDNGQGFTQEQLDKLMELVLKGSLRWPSKYLDKVFGKHSHQSIPHPKSSLQGALLKEDIERWAERVEGRT